MVNSHLRKKKKQIHAVGAFIYCLSTNRYLFLLRNTTRFRGTWGLAGGKVEQNESLMTALHREINEELGTDLSANKLIPIEKFTSDQKNFTFDSFLLIIGEEFTPTLNEEHRGYCWVTLEDHPRPLHPGVYRTINFKEVTTKIQEVVAELINLSKSH